MNAGFFDHTVALASLRVADWLDGSDHSALMKDWLEMAKAKLIHPATGLLISSYTTQAQMLDGPEGSSIWMSAWCLKLVDPSFASQQFIRAKRELGRSVFGFAWSREWPVLARNSLDVDSGAVIPIVDANAGGSGLAFVGAAGFRDREFFEKLQTTLDFAAFPRREQGRLRYCASNQVGDAVLLYAHVLGPAWELVQRKMKIQ